MPTPFADGITITPAPQVGPPTTGAWEKGTIIVDDAGVPYICTASGSPGTWIAIGVGTIPPASLVKQFPEFADTFVNGLTTSGAWNISGGGSATQIAPPTGTTSRNDVIGVLNLATGTATTGRYGAILGASLLRFDAPGVFSAWSRVLIPTLGTATDDFRFQFGFKDNNNGDSTDGAFFEYDRTLNGGQKWSINTVSNGTRTKQIIPTDVVAGQWYDISVEVDAAVPSAEFVVNDAVVGTIVTNIPTTGGRETSVGFEIRKTIGGNTRSVYMDYVYIKRSRV